MIQTNILEKLGKILPRLASDHEAEVLATVAAIRRTLAGVSLDLNDLAQHLGNSGIPTFTTDGPDWSDIVRQARDGAEAAAPKPAAKPAKPKREPSPWPSFSSMRHQQRCEWLRTAESMQSAVSVDREAFAALKSKIVSRPHELMTRKEINLFNTIVRSAWNAGVRWETEKAA